MSANIFEDRFVSVRTLAWHNLGKVIQEDVDLIQALEIAGLDYNIVTENLMTESGLVLPNKVAMVREKTTTSPDTVLGVVSDHYQVIQNRELAEIFNPLTDYWKVETAGALGEGETVFFVLDAGEVELNGDNIHQYFLIADRKDGKEATSLVYTPVRVVCQNTLNTGMAQAKLTFRIRHSRDNKTYLSKIAGLHVKMLESIRLTNQLFEKFQVTRFSLPMMREMVKKLYPEVKREKTVTSDIIDVTTDFEKISQNALESQLVTVELFKKFNDEFPQFAESSWGAYNAVTEWESHRTGKFNGGQYSSALWGTRGRTMQEAFKILSAKK